VHRGVPRASASTSALVADRAKTRQYFTRMRDRLIAFAAIATLLVVVLWEDAPSRCGRQVVERQER
jgi:hypothetical protein